MKLAALCVFVGLISLTRSFYTVCFDADGDAQNCARPTKPIEHIGGGVDPVDAGLGFALIIAAPLAALNIRRPF